VLLSPAVLKNFLLDKALVSVSCSIAFYFIVYFGAYPPLFTQLSQAATKAV